MAGTTGTWVPPSQRVGADYDESESLAAKFERMASGDAPAKNTEAAAAEPVPRSRSNNANVPKAKVAESLARSSLFSVQQATIAAEESHVMTCEVKGQALTTVHPSQINTEEGDEDKVPSWRMEQVKANERENNSTYDLPARQAARVKERAKAKREAERAAKKLIAEGLPDLEAPEASASS